MSEALRFQKVLDFVSDFFFMDEPSSSFARVLKDLMEACPECVVVGGIALSFYVENPRTTKDVDIVLLQVTPFRDRLKEFFDEVPDKPFTLRHKETSIEVDFLTLDHPLINREILALVPVQFNVITRAGTDVKVVKPNLLLGLKLARAVHNTQQGFQDRADILSLLNDNPGLNLESIIPKLSDDEREMLDDLVRFGEGESNGRP